MNKEKNIPNQPDFSSSDPTEAFQAKAARKFFAEQSRKGMDVNGTVSFSNGKDVQTVVQKAQGNEPVDPYDSLGVWDQKMAKPAGIKFN